MRYWLSRGHLSHISLSSGQPHYEQSPSWPGIITQWVMLYDDITRLQGCQEQTRVACHPGCDTDAFPLFPNNQLLLRFLYEHHKRDMYTAIRLRVCCFCRQRSIKQAIWQSPGGNDHICCSNLRHSVVIDINYSPPSVISQLRASICT